MNFREYVKEQRIAKENELSKEQEQNFPCFLMCPPYNLDNRVLNNYWMKQLPTEERKIDQEKAISQWLLLQQNLAVNSMTYLIPASPGLQDQTYVANLGIILPHMKKSTVVISNFTSSPRLKEKDAGIEFFKLMGYDIHVAPQSFRWEGEADLKYVHDNIYIGGYGIRTDFETLAWFESTFNMKVIKMKMTDEKLYHFDCCCFPLNNEKVMLCTEVFDKEEVKEVEKVAEIVDVPKRLAYNDATNDVRCGNFVFSGSPLMELKRTDEEYDGERDKVEFLSKVCSKNAMEPLFFNISELRKSGAACSCCVMHLNYIDYKYNLLG